jgi:hypothetical protein
VGQGGDRRSGAGGAGRGRAGGDGVAAGIVEGEARELARTAAGAVRAGGLPLAGVPVALTGGLVVESAAYRERFLSGAARLRGDARPVGVVDDPVLGAVVLARKLLG